MRQLYFVVALVALLLVCLPLAAEEIWSELVPDHAGVSLQLNRADGQLNAGIQAMGCWRLFTIGEKAVEGDLWNIDPFGGGLSYPVFGPRFLGLGYDDSLPGPWHDRIVVYGKTIVEVAF